MWKMMSSKSRAPAAQSFFSGTPVDLYQVRKATAEHHMGNGALHAVIQRLSHTCGKTGYGTFDDTADGISVSGAGCHEFDHFISGRLIDDRKLSRFSGNQRCIGIHGVELVVPYFTDGGNMCENRYALFFQKLHADSSRKTNRHG